MSVLQSVVNDVRIEVDRRCHEVSLDEVKRRAKLAPSPLNALGALRNSPGAVAIMAEIKRSSPGAGHLADIPDPARLAREYEDGGAALISCVTETIHFHGSFDDLRAVRRAVDLPILCKDIIITPYQIHEARANGADMILLFASVLDQQRLRSFIERAESLGMDALVEVQTRLEVVRALDAGAKAIGVNSRNLHTLEVDRSHIDQVIDLVPSDVIAVAESGVRGPHDVFSYAKSGADAVLVGEALVTSTNPRSCVADMVSAGQHPALQTDRKARVKRGRLERQYACYREDYIA